MNKVQTLLAAIVCIVLCNVVPMQSANAQCAAGEVEITIDVTTDDWGYECYWELVPSGDGCQNNTGTTIFAGGNALEVGCAGGGAQVATAGNGYANQTTITEGPWCLTDGNMYDIEYVDDYGDGGASFVIYGDGIPFDNTTFGNPTSAAVHTFTAQVGVGLPNDSCPDAIDIFCGTDTMGTTINATVNAPAAGSCGAGGTTAPSVWYHFTGTGDAIELSTCNAGTDYDTRITVYEGTCGALTCVAGNDDGPANPGPCSVLGGAGADFTSQVNFTSVMGTDYYIMIHGFDPGGAPESGNFQLTVACTTPCSPVPANDDCATAQALTLSSAGTCGATTGTNTCASAAIANPSCDPFGIINDVWYSFNSGSNTDLTITIDSVSATTINWALYDTCGNADLICNNGFGATPITGFQQNTTYLLQVWNAGGSQEGDFDICIEEPLPFDGVMSAFGFPSEYSIVPISQAQPWDMIGLLTNNGGQPITNVTMSVDITTGGASVYTDMSTPIDTLFPNQDTILTLTNTYLPTDTGVFNIEYLIAIAEADGNTSNDTLNFTMIVSDTAYARDLNNASGSLGVGAGASAILGNLYEITNPTDITSISAFIGGAVIGDTTKFVVYDVVGGIPQVEVAASAEYIFTAADTGGVFLTLPIAGGPQALVANDYFVGVEEYTSTDNLGIGTDDFIYTLGHAMGNINGAAFDSLENLGGFQVAMIVRANLVPPCFVDATATITDASCNGFSDGSIDLLPTGGTFYSYAWSNGSNNQDLTNLGAATFTVTVSDNNCLSFVDSFTVGQPAAISIATSSTDESCGAADGSATAMATGGTGPFSYSWSNGDTTATSGNLPAGNYTVTATDSIGCFVDSMVTVNGTAAVTLDMDTTDASCNNANGSAMVTVLSGAMPYTYAWSDGQSTATATGLAAGSYTVVVTDNNGCVDSASVTVGDTQGVVIGTSSTQSTCGLSDGTATATPSAGVSPYTYLWSDGQTTQTATGLGAGIYDVTVIGSNGCADSSSIAVSDNSTLAATTDSVEVTCGLANGSATVTATGGTSPYTYAWGAPAGNQTTATATGLTIGNYNVSVTDNAGCLFPATATVTGTIAVTASTTTTDETCGNSDGTATATPTTGDAPFSYLWSDGATTQTTTGLAPGSVTVTVTDNNGCSTTETVTIVGAGAPTATVTASSDASCNAGNDGSITVTVMGGVMPYMYDWTDNGDTTNTTTTSMAGSLMAGVYTLTITDSTGCSVAVTDTLTEPTAIVTSMTAVDPSCPGGTDGSATVMVTGGTQFGGGAPYLYSWAFTGGVDTTDTGLGAGLAKVFVTDANNCVAEDSIILNDPAPIMTMIAATDITCFGSTDGSATVTATQGTAPYSYLWSNSDTAATTSGLGAGSVSVVVTDANGCTAADSTDIVEPTALSLAGNSTPVTCTGDTDGLAVVGTTGGTPAYTYLWSDGQTGNPAMNLAPGPIAVTVTDANGCSDSTSVTVDEPTPVVVTVDSIVDESEPGANDGAIYITPSGGTGPYTYAWSSGSGVEDQIGVAGGTYTVTVTDDNGCTETATDSVGTGVGIADILRQVDLRVVPNPNNGQFALRFNLDKAQRFELTMRNSLGQLVYNESLNVGHHSTKNLSLGHLGRGVYFLQVRNGEMEAIRKVVIH